MKMTTKAQTTTIESCSKIANIYMRDAITEIDSIYGQGYAKANPLLIGEYMRSATAIYSITVQSMTITDGVGTLALSL